MSKGFQRSSANHLIGVHSHIIIQQPGLFSIISLTAVDCFELQFINAFASSHMIKSNASSSNFSIVAFNLSVS